MWISHDLVGVYATVVLAATSIAAIADQNGRFVGAHEVPPFVCERVELVAGNDNGLAAELSHGVSDRFAPSEVSHPGCPVCAREA